ncbi:hypothetical protein ACGY1D_31095, partial [Burkholderia pseudomallei]
MTRRFRLSVGARGGARRLRDERCGEVVRMCFGGVPLCLSSNIIGGFGLVNGAVAQHGEQHVA